MEITVIQAKKMKKYLEWCKKQLPSTTICDNCNKMVKIETTPYFYDEENNDVYFASLCPECGELIITKE